MRFLGALLLTGISTLSLAQTPNLPAALEQLLAPTVKPNQITLAAQVDSLLAPATQGTSTIIARRDGSGSVTNTFPTQVTGRLINATANATACTFTDQRGPQPMAGHNCLQDQIWELPLFLVVAERGPALFLSKTNALRFTPQLPPSAKFKLDFHAAYDLVIGSDGFPSAVRFAAHPDNDSLVDIAIEYRYSNYALESGVYLPHTIEKYVNGGLTLRYQIQSAVVN